jgi:hypothetical protein
MNRSRIRAGAHLLRNFALPAICGGFQRRAIILAEERQIAAVRVAPTAEMGPARANAWPLAPGQVTVAGRAIRSASLLVSSALLTGVRRTLETASPRSSVFGLDDLAWTS